MIQMNLFTKQIDSQTQKTHLCLPKGTAADEGVNQAFGINVYTLPNTK